VKLETATAREYRLNTLLDKLEKWLLQQPEWMELMLQNRKARRRAATLVAQELMKLPVRESNPQLNREMRRRIWREVKSGAA
jgi:hypothetical protein